MNDNNNKKYTFSDLKGAHKAVPIILGALAVFIAICLFTGLGSLGEGMRVVFRGLFSWGSVMIPIALIAHAVFYPADLGEKKIVRRAIFSAVSLLLVSCVEYAIFSWGKELVFAPTEAFTNMNAGGFVGSVIGFGLAKLVGQLGVIIISAAVLAIYALFFFAEKAGSLGQLAIKVKEKVKLLIKGINDKHGEYVEKKRQQKEDEEQHQREVSSQELIDDEFFKAKGEASSVKIKKLGIDESADTHGTSPLVDPAKRVIEEEPVIVKEPERRKRADKPLDLTYGIEEEPESEPEVEEEPAKEEKPKYDKAFFGQDDSADNVFTKDFDPFDFATSEKASAKYASKVSTKSAVAEELDDMTLYEMRANHEPTEREKRRMELEAKKKAWMESRKPAARPEPVAPPVADVALLPATEAPKTSIPTDTVSEAEPVSAPAYTPAPESKPEKVNSYNPYSTKKTAFNQPKTVEFTISKGPAPIPDEPVESPAVSMTLEKAVQNENEAEDVAILISKRIAQNNPAYARSANDLKTYTKVVSNEDDELYRQLQGISTPMESSESSVQNAEFENEVAESVDVIDDDNSLVLTDDVAEPVTESEPVVEELTLSEAEPIPEAEPVKSEEPMIPESVEFSIGEEKNDIPEPSAQFSYQRAAGFASAMVSEQAEPEFKPYTPPTTPIEPASAPTYTEENTLRVERSMLPPTPEAVPVAATAAVTGAAAAPVAATAAVTSAAAAPVAATATAASAAAVAAPAVVDFALADEAEASAPVTAEPITAEPLFTMAEDFDIEEEDNGEDIDIDDDEISFDDDEDEDPLDDGELPEEEEYFDDEPIPPEEQNPDVNKMREMFPFLKRQDEQKPASMPAAEEKSEITLPADDISDVPFDEPVQVKMAETSLVPANEKKAKNEKKSKKPDYSDFKFPPLDLLAKQQESADENIQAEIQENADKLIETLASFGVTASIKGVDRGPRITRYEVVPAKGVKVSSILNLQDDIALNLAAGSIRMEAPIPGKSAVGIEIPNKKSSIVRLRDLLETAEFEGNKSKTFVCIGRDVAGQPVFGDLAKMPHLLIAGATGMGKSVCINSLLISVLYKARPDEVKLIMIDPKQVEFTMYNGIPHLLVPVVSDAKQAAGALMWAVDEMERRYNLLNSLYVRSVDAYNEKVTDDPSLGEFLPKIIIVIDEFADLMLQVKDPVEQLVTRIAQKARAAGIHLVIGTQRPSVNVITGVIKANVPSRISCKVMSNVDSKTVLDSAGAEKLLDKGDSLYAPAGSPKPHRLQCAFVADSEVEHIMKYLQQFSNGDSYDSSVMEDIERAAQKCNKKGGGGDRDDSDVDSGSGEGYLNDRQFLDAVEIAVNTRKISTSLIQRKLSIGYGKAAKFIDIMEDMGIVGEANGQRPREVLLTPDEWREKLARASLD